MTTNVGTPEQIRNAWEALAPAFDDVVTAVNVEHGTRMLRWVDVGPRTRFLDVAAGSGALSIPAARLGADVTAVDVAPTMIERLADRARDEGLTQVQGHVMDGCALRFDDNTFDVSASQHGVSLFPDVHRGLTELVRVTKPGGQVLIVAFGPLAKAEYLGLFFAAASVAMPGFVPPADPPPLPFQLADAKVFSSVLTAAGLADVRVDTVTWDMTVGSAAHLWRLVTASNPVGAQLAARLSDAQRAEAQGVLDGMLRERSGGERGAVLHAEINVGVGRA